MEGIITGKSGGIILRYAQGCSDGGYIGIYPQNQSTIQIFMWLLVVFFLFDPGQIVVDFETGMTS